MSCVKDRYCFFGIHVVILNFAGRKLSTSLYQEGVTGKVTASPTYNAWLYCLHHNLVYATTSGGGKIYIWRLIDYVISVVLSTYNRNIFCANLFSGFNGL